MEPTSHAPASAPPDPDADRAPPDYNLEVLRGLLTYLRDVRGAGALESVAAAAGLAPERLAGAPGWVSHRQCEAILAAANDLLGGDEDALRAASCYRYADRSNWIRYLLRGASPLALFLRSNVVGPVLTRGGRFVCAQVGRWRVRVSYTNPNRESRLICLSRRCQFERLPTLCGFDPAESSHARCIGLGDDACEYEFWWRERPTARPLVVGVLLGCLLQVAVTPTGAARWLGHVALPALGAALGALRVGRAAKAVREADAADDEALDALIREQQEARAAMLEYHERQRAWSERLEERAGDHAAALRALAERMRRVERERALALRGLSHDLRNPLAVVRLGVERLLEAEAPDGDRAALADIERAATEMEALLAQLVASASEGADLVRVEPRRVPLAPLVERVERQLRVLVHGRPVAVAVAAAALPEAIEVDPLVLDRIVDNLLSNAAKYTGRGSIRVELRAVDACLAVDVADTGIGIAPERVLDVLRPRAARVDAGAEREGHGIGLSGVVRLLDAVGGRLEVASKPGAGTRFTVYVPVRPVERLADGGDALARVVRVLPWNSGRDDA